MIRTSLLALYVTAAALYASKDWFKSLCALILLLAVIEHPDMPKSILGIQGLNPWNLLLLFVVVGWLRARKQEGLTWDLPRGLRVWLLMYLGVVLVGWVRMVANPSHLNESLGGMISEHLINTVKWIIPGIMLYDGARNRERFRLGVVCVIAVYFLLSVQVIRWMPLRSAASGEALSERSVKILVNEVGYHRVNMSAMLAGASWAILAARPLADTSNQRMILLGASAIAVFGQALTAGRAGYVTWIAVGFILSLLRWRRYLFLAPVLVVGVLTLAPGVAERMLEGFTRTEDGEVREGGADVYTITAGRSLAWPLVIDKIKERPILGYGREAMTRTGISAYLAQFGEGFSHPHNAYLETLLDNGLVGFLVIVPFHVLLLWRSIALFRDSRSPVFVAIGGVASAFLLALMIAAMGSQTFYPREGWAGMWCALFLMLRVYEDRRHWLASEVPARARPLAARPTLVRPRRVQPVARAVPGRRTEAPTGGVVEDFSSPAREAAGGIAAPLRTAAGARKVERGAPARPSAAFRPAAPRKRLR
jgi:O-antigen ligase